MKQIMYFFLSGVASWGLFAQTYQYQLKGSFNLGPAKQRAVNYVLRWSEENGTISGAYSDNVFSSQAKVTGEESVSGRIFEVKFPEKKNGVKSLIILTSLARHPSAVTLFPVGVVARDEIGNPLSTFKTTSEFMTTSFRSLAQQQEENSCFDGFGVLAGYCGVYAGLLTEEQDRRNRCNLLFSDAIRLELTSEAMVVLHLGEVNEFFSSPAHAIGRLPVNPPKSSIDLMSRSCAPLSGVNSSGPSCKILHLMGSFSLVKGGRHFKGEYTIQEEGTNNICRYGLSMDKVE